MGTSNFYTANASATYVVNYENNDWAWQECQELIADDIKEHLPNFEPSTDLTSAKNLRSFPASSIGFIQDSIHFLGLEWEFRVSVFLRAGYYDAANLDCELEFWLDGHDYFDSYESAMDDISCDPSTYDIKPGLWIIHQSNLFNKLDKFQSSMIQSIEDVLAKVSTPYGVVARFSNGETIYEKLGA